MKSDMRHDDQPKLTVSVVIPAYNCAAYIREAVDSALGQSRVPDEIIVVDDGSTDGTHRVLAEYEAPVRVIRQVNAGESAARNTGLRAARGDLIAFLDGDDTFTTGSIARRIEIFEASPEVGVVYGDMYVMNAAGEPLGRHRDYMPGARPSGYILPDLAVRSFILIPAMIRRSILGDQTFDESLHHCPDYDFWRKLAAHCQFRYLDEPVAHYRIHDANKIVMQPRSIQECELIVQQRIFAMPEFQRLSRGQKARAYRHHGAKNAVLGRMGAAQILGPRGLGQSAVPGGRGPFGTEHARRPRPAVGHLATSQDGRQRHDSRGLERACRIGAGRAARDGVVVLGSLETRKRTALLEIV